MLLAVTAADRPTTPQSRAETAAAARDRIISTALDLFSRNGVAGTSLQMIADEIGITKAAVYHHYKTKEQIVLAVAEDELARMEGTIDAAEDEPTWEGAREALVANMIDLAVERRGTAGTILYDPFMGRLVPENDSFRRVMRRMSRMLMGKDAGPDARVRTDMLIAAISGVAVHPLAAGLDDDRLRSELSDLARSFLDKLG